MSGYRIGQREIDRLQQEWLIGQATGHCLHVGCGEKPIAGAVNIDPNPSRAAWADLAYDVHELPAEWGGSFDSVVSSHVLPSLRDLDRAMAEMIRVLKTGGHMAHVIPDWTHAPRRCDPEKEWQFQRQGWHGPEAFRPYIEQFADSLRLEELRHFPKFEFSFRVVAIKL